MFTEHLLLLLVLSTLTDMFNL